MKEEGIVCIQIATKNWRYFVPWAWRKRMVLFELKGLILIGVHIILLIELILTLITLSFTLISAPLSWRSFTISSLPPRQAQWMAVQSNYIEK